MYALSTGQIFIQWRVLSYLRTTRARKLELTSMSLINILHNNSLKEYLPLPKAKLAQFIQISTCMGHQKPSSRLHVGLLENAQAVNEKPLMLLISGGNWFAIKTIPHVYRIVVPSSFPLLAMLLWDMVRPLKPYWVL